jgi:hypothetical protein
VEGVSILVPLLGIRSAMLRLHLGFGPYLEMPSRSFKLQLFADPITVKLAVIRFGSFGMVLKIRQTTRGRESVTFYVGEWARESGVEMVFVTVIYVAHLLHPHQRLQPKKQT